jgi:hypothetical protein
MCLGCLILATALYLFSSLVTLSSREFSEGEDEIVSVEDAIAFSKFTVDPKWVLYPFVTERMPFAYLFLSPVTLFSPVNELTLRLPNILFGAATVWLLFALGQLLFDNRTALLSVSLYVCSGAFAVNRLTIGISNCVFFVTLSLLFLTRYIASNRVMMTSRSLILSATALLIASLTFQDSLMFAMGFLFSFAMISFGRNASIQPVLRSILLFSAILVGGLVLYYLGGIAIYIVRQCFVHQPIDVLSFGPIAHLMKRSEGVLSRINVLEYLRTYADYNSLIYALVLSLGILLSLAKRGAKTLHIFIFAAPHAFTWMFLVKGSLFEHPLFALPVFAVVASMGYINAWDWLRAKQYRGLSFLLLALYSVSLLYSFVSNNAYFNGFFSQLLPQHERHIGGHGNIRHVGFKTAGWIVREHPLSNGTVYVDGNMSGAIGYYADSRVKRVYSTADIDDIAVGFLILPPESPLQAHAASKAEAISIVVHQGKELLSLYFIGIAPSELASAYDTATYDQVYDALYSFR